LRRWSARESGDGGGPALVDWQAWLTEHFPSYVSAPFAARHEALWEWVWAIQYGERPLPYVGIWPRGGAKSTSAELACVAVATRKSRRYGWYICETQDQADDHVANAAALFEAAGFDRAVNKYGTSKGWRRNRIRTPNFTLDALGLDVARRGAKLDEQRPDWMVIDDVDSEEDTPLITEKKIRTLTKKLLPAGTPDLAVLAIQNLVHAHSIFSRFIDGRADFLTDRIVSGPYKAVEGLEYTTVNGEPRITGGMPTWEGQDLPVCEQQMRTWGIAAFLSESQQEVGREGRFFKMWDEHAHTCNPRPIDKGWVFWGSLDHGHAHPTSFHLHAATGDGMVETVAEHVLARALPGEHCEAIHKLLAELGLSVDSLRATVAGSDVFAQKGDEYGLTIADQYAKGGIRLSEASTERVSGAAEMRNRLGNPAKGIAPTWQIWKTCPRLIACIPRMVADPKRLEDVLKVNADRNGNGGDDEYDDARYGLMFHRPSPANLVAFVGGEDEDA
jgi:hypothetical protein